jgi:hypothetical protein
MITKTFGPQSLGKTTPNSMARKEAQPHKHIIPIHRPYTEWVMEDDHNPSGLGG